MSLGELGNALYFGVFASFCGGWVPVRSKNLKLIVFHLYVFLSLLILPLLIKLVNDSHPVGWIVYSLFTGAWFIFLKVLNYRLHKALGNDPEPETVNEGNETKDPEHKNEDPEHENDDPEHENEDPEHENEDPEHENEKAVSEDSVKGIVVISEINQPLEEDHSGIMTSQYLNSAAILNDIVTATIPTTTTPTIELSTLSHEKTDQRDTIPDHDINSPMHKSVEMDSDEDVDERPSSATTRERVCQRMTRNESINGRSDTKLSVDSLNEDFIDNVNNVLLANDQLFLVEVVNKMPKEVHQAIVAETISSDNYDSLNNRIEILKRGHLSLGENDDSPGSIHWFEQNGEWDFYKFDNTDDDDQYVLHNTINNDNDGIEHWAIGISTNEDNSNNISAPQQNDDSTDINMTPNIKLLPYLKWSTIELKFARTKLEEYMDRNVTILELLTTITLAVLVCVIGALLFTMTDFFINFWLFWLCFVIATCQFSLIKSVQSDAASPGPGQNRTNAISRSIYFILIGSISLLLNYIVTLNLPILCLFGFDVTNVSVFVFIRDALFIFLLFFPILFTIGWMPQFDTFLINILEQIDVHVFGGSASTGLVCSIYALARSCISTIIIIPLGYAGFYYLEMGINDLPVINCDTNYLSVNDITQCSPGGRISFSFLLGGVVSVAYFLSRSTSNHQYIFDILQFAWMKISKSKLPYEEDPLDTMYRNTVLNRLKVDVFVVVCVFMAVTIINISSAFCHTVILYYSIVGITVVIGIINHYLLPHSRKENPYLCFTQPCLKSDEYSVFEVTVAPKVSVTERILQITTFIEKNIFYPLVFLIGINLSAVYYKAKFGNLGAAILLSIVGIKIFRSAFSDLSRQHVILILSFLFFNFDYRHLSEGLPLEYFIMAILVNKIYDLYLKTYFMFIYIIPSSWSHPFHIIIQPLLIPHCPVIYLQTIIGSIINAPMNPVIASPMFFLSYARPIKFWEKNYNTKRRDTTNTRLDQTLDGNMRNPNPDQLDSLFYEQLTWSLQRDLCGDINLGRWGRVTSGDIFILTNDQLNALVHIIEIGNGFVTFQLRGLEFRGTYCHQREREAITEPLTNDDDTCHLPFVLPCKKLCVARWMAWEVISSSYTLHGYSITENQAHLVFNAYVYKKAFITYYVRCIIYYILKSPRLPSLLDNTDLKNSLLFLDNSDSCDVDSLFTSMYNIDWNHGITRQSFITAYYEMIKTCADKRHLSKSIDTTKESFLVTLCFAFSLLGRRMFFTHANTGAGNRNDNFMHGLYRMFIGDARPCSDKDDWIFQAIDCIQEIIIPASRITLKIHQDNFTMAENYESPASMYEGMLDAETNHVITHENDKSWRDAVALNKTSLLALRYQRAEDTYMNPYKIIRLNSKFVKFRLIKVNRECVRGLWSSQQHELIFLRNSDSERGSIQNHKASLRNMINSSMDLPIGYPIYVSPLQTSFLDLHESFNKTIIGRAINPQEYTKIIDKAQKLCQTCSTKEDSSNSKVHDVESEVSDSPVPIYDNYIDPFGESDDDDDDFWKPMFIGKHVTIANIGEVFETFNEGWLQWPDKMLYQKATKTHWKQWRPIEGVTNGEVIHEWRPFHIQSTCRSHIDKVILLIQVAGSDNLVLVKEQGIQLSS